MPFVDYKPFQRPCLAPEHDPPMNQLLPPGEHVWQCPNCNHKTIIRIPEIR